MKIIIIGCGYVGKAIALRWKDAGFPLTLTTTTLAKLSQLEDLGEKVCLLKTQERDRLKSLLQGQEIVLLSIAPRARDLATYRQTYLETAENLTWALKDNHSVRQVIYTGSYAILGDQQGAWVDEETPPAPANENSRVLWDTEKVLLALGNRDLKVCILRLAGIYGPGRELVKIFRSWAGTTRAGDGQEYANWVHLEDIVNAIELIREKNLEGLYNLSNLVPQKKSLLLDRLCEKHNLPKINWAPSALEVRPYNVRLSVDKIQKAGLELIYPETLL
jgi:nucleoside-diphosphate-sugar epimerase